MAADVAALYVKPLLVRGDLLMWKSIKLGMGAVGLAFIILMVGVVGYAIGDTGTTTTTSNTRPAPESSGEDYGILNEIQSILEEDFVNPEAVNPDILHRGAIDGLIESLADPHTVYISPEDFAVGIDIISGAFEGIGAQVDQDPVTGEIVIVAPFRGSPAEAAGILPGDVLVSVNGQSTEGWSVADAVKEIRGPQGTEVVIGVRHSDGTEEEVAIERATIEIPTVFADEVTGQDGSPIENLAYLEIQQFTDQTAGDLDEELNRITDAGYDGLILDLRRNPGGGLDATVDVADMFLDEGIIITQVDRDGRETTYEANPGNDAGDLPVVVLVGPGSASGSEVLAAALRDHGRATLIGEKTFGKGSVNHIRNLSNGGALYVTIARWRTPNGELIEGVGLEPDVAVALTPEDVAANRDTQLFAAIDFLQNGAQAQNP
jgi:carboxyl-terminal processing protease